MKGKEFWEPVAVQLYRAWWREVGRDSGEYVSWLDLSEERKLAWIAIAQVGSSRYLERLSEYLKDKQQT